MSQEVLPEVDDQVPDIVVDDLTEAQKIDFLTSVGDVSHLGTDNMLYHDYHHSAGSGTILDNSKLQRRGGIHMEDQNAQAADLPVLTDEQKAEFLAALDTGDARAGTDGLRLHYHG